MPSLDPTPSTISRKPISPAPPPRPCSSRPDSSTPAPRRSPASSTTRSSTPVPEPRQRSPSAARLASFSSSTVQPCRSSNAERSPTSNRLQKCWAASTLPRRSTGAAIPAPTASTLPGVSPAASNACRQARSTTLIRSAAGMSAARKLPLARPRTVPRRSATAAVVVAAPMSRPRTTPARARNSNRRAGRPFCALPVAAASFRGASSSLIQPRRIRSSQTAITDARVRPVHAIRSVPVATSVPRMAASTAWALTRRNSWGVAAACGFGILTSP